MRVEQDVDSLSLEMIESPNRERVISFRINQNEYEGAESAAAAAGIPVNAWARLVVLAESGAGLGMTPGEWESFKQLSIVRHLTGVMLRHSLSPEAFAKVKKEIEEYGQDIAEETLRESRKQ